MPRFSIEVTVMPRAALLDPQGQAVRHALSELDFRGLEQVRVGRAITIELERADGDSAARDAREMCEKLLANPVTEDFGIQVKELA